LKRFLSIIIIWLLCCCAPAAAGFDVIDYTPSSLLHPGQVELKVFNNLYTQTKSFNTSGSKIPDGQRSTFFTGIAYFSYGVSPRWNAGVDVYLKSVHTDKESGSAFSVFKFSGGSGARTSISSIAPKIKAAPFARIPALSVQTSFLIPAASNMEGRPKIDKPFLDYDAYQWWTQVFYDLTLRENLMVYIEGGLLARFFDSRTDLLTPVKTIFNIYPTRTSIVYVLGELGPTWDGANWNSYYTQVGLGAKYQVTPHLELETLFSIFPVGKMNGAGGTMNMGLRWLY